MAEGLPALAHAAAMSRSSFATRFQEVVGASPLQFIRELRMRRAQMLLREGKSVAAVAALVGYDSKVAVPHARVESAGRPACTLVAAITLKLSRQTCLFDCHFYC